MKAREIYKCLKEQAYGGQWVYVVYNKQSKTVDIHNFSQGLQWWRQYEKDAAVFVWMGKQSDIPSEEIFQNLVCFDYHGNLIED